MKCHICIGDAYSRPRARVNIAVKNDVLARARDGIHREIISLIGIGYTRENEPNDCNFIRFSGTT